tara:strand:- start:250 stop:387 length:138 start_codon:yes stop_codon:yes gene_type:complete
MEKKTPLINKRFSVKIKENKRNLMNIIISRININKTILAKIILYK